MAEIINARQWAIKQRLQELINFLTKFPDSEYAPRRRKEKNELEEELKNYE
jgi:outer membrane protein assembly factor BamD (BamD/ComL family)